MPKINKIQVDTVVSTNDKVLGSDITGVTRNYTLKSIANHFKTTNAIGGAISSFSFMNSDNADANGEMELNNTVWASVTSVDVSIYQYDDDVTSFADGLTMLEGKDIILIQSSDQNIYGIYTAGSLGTPDATTPGNICSLPLTYKTHKGAPVLSELYTWQDIGTDGDFTGSVKITKNLRRTVTTATESPSNTFTCDLSLNDNFKFTVNNAASQTIALTVATENIGQSGNIIITNPTHNSVLAFTALPAYMKTPSGATVNFDTTVNKIAVISYIVLATDSILVNYIGDFS